MSRIQDVFGGSPKTVLNKPLMHVQDQKTQGTDGGGSVDGDNDRDLNTILTNEISGASLSSNEVTLPAGTYWIEAEAPLVLGTYRAYLDVRKSDDTVLLSGTNSGEGTVGSGKQINRVRGRLTFTTSTTIKLVHVSDNAVASTGLGNATSARTEVYSDLCIWKLDSNIETVILSDPTLTLARPLMHVQDQKTQGTEGGGNSAGFNQRDLSTVLVNEISGASLGTNQITLPAGDYYIEALAPARSDTNNNNASRLFLRDSSANTILVGQNTGGYAGAITVGNLTGRFTLSQSTTIQLDQYILDANTINSLGDALNVAPYEVYTDVRIWQLDAVVRTPVLVNDKLYPLPGSTMVTGNMHGLEYEYTSANQITVQPGICMDSTNNEVLSLSSATAVSIGTTINEIYNLFICKLGSTVTIQTDTDVDGANLSSQDYIRWIGFVRTNSSGNMYEFDMADDALTFSAPITMIATASSGTTKYTMSTFFPTERCSFYRIATNSRFAQNRGAGLYLTESDGTVGPEVSYMNCISSTYTERFECVSRQHEIWLNVSHSSSVGWICYAVGIKR